MRVHYALMDDLCSWEEFERLVEEKAGSAADESDERSAAREVVSDAGRLHTRLSELKGGPSLVSFFCSVIEVKKAERFDRPGGGEGFVSRILCGDETGEVMLTLWDDKAFASAEISEGEILEVVGRFRRRGSVDVSDLRKPENPPVITLRKCGMRTFSPVSIECVILAFAREGSFRSSDGSDSGYMRVITGDAAGEAEIMFWNNDVPKGFHTGDNVRITGIYERPSSGSKRSYSADENAGISLISVDPEAMIHDFQSRISDLNEDWSGSISVTIDDPGEVREFVTRKGVVSHVRNLEVSDEGGTAVLVVWGEQACLPFSKGDEADIFFAGAKESSVRPGYAVSSSRIEIHAGYGSWVSLAESGGREVSIKGMVIPRDGYFSLDNREGGYPLKGLKEGMQPCMEAEVRGILYDSGRLEPDEFRLCGEEPSSLKSRLEEIKRRYGC